jgi:hypothetical protein
MGLWLKVVDCKNYLITLFAGVALDTASYLLFGNALSLQVH